MNSSISSSLDHFSGRIAERNRSFHKRWILTEFSSSHHQFCLEIAYYKEKLAKFFADKTRKVCKRQESMQEVNSFLLVSVVTLTISLQAVSRPSGSSSEQQHCADSATPPLPWVIMNEYGPGSPSLPTPAATLAEAVLHQQFYMYVIFETNTYEYVLEVFIRIYVHILAYVFVCIDVRTQSLSPRRIFVRIWTYTVRICSYPCSYLHVSQSVSARIPVRICTYPSSYLHVSWFVSARILLRIWMYTRTDLHVSRLYLNVSRFVFACALFVSAFAI